ncbi:hypothetical protein RIF29_39304 [Crotalaria pallida]|uniref:Uncharacterized protein n=1 Tax=Crotalaria pallida TaxID=3830 RepID=A0AAN9E2M8_CROPI
MKHHSHAEPTAKIFIQPPRADTRVFANSSEVLSDVPFIPLLVDLSAPATDDSIASSTLVPPAQEHPAPHSSSTSGSIHPMVTRRS